MVFYDFIEIGTSDFHCEIINADNMTRGLSVEPVSFYLNKLPDRDHCIKANCAISDHDGTIDLYHVPLNLIQQFQLPNWIRGCNSVDKPHPTVARILKSRSIKLEDAMLKSVVPVITLSACMAKYQVAGTYFLKLDTEGHDTIILKKFLSEIKDNFLLPHKIVFESNVLSDQNMVKEVIRLAQDRGYELKTTGHDTHLRLNLGKVKKEGRFSNKIDNYYLAGYPNNYNPDKLPHPNTLKGAMDYCEANNHGGVTYQYGRYEVRAGQYLFPYREKQLNSWTYL